jgi:hypothetical protein
VVICFTLWQFGEFWGSFVTFPSFWYIISRKIWQPWLVIILGNFARYAFGEKEGDLIRKQCCAFYKSQQPLHRYKWWHLLMLSTKSHQQLLYIEEVLQGNNRGAGATSCRSMSVVVLPA